MASYNKNLNAVVDHLDGDESVIQSCGGLYQATVLGTESFRSGIFVVTEKRVIFFGKKLGGYDFESFPLSKISAIEMSEHWLKGFAINLKMSGNTAKMTNIKVGNPIDLVKYVRDNMGEMSTAPQTASVTNDIPTQIQKLAALMEAGILTEDEFTAKKTELLAKM